MRERERERERRQQQCRTLPSPDGRLDQLPQPPLSRLPLHQIHHSPPRRPLLTSAPPSSSFPDPASGRPPSLHSSRPLFPRPVTTDHNPLPPRPPDPPSFPISFAESAPPPPTTYPLPPLLPPHRSRPSSPKLGQTSTASSPDSDLTPTDHRFCQLRPGSPILHPLRPSPPLETLTRASIRPPFDRSASSQLRRRSSVRDLPSTTSGSTLPYPCYVRQFQLLSPTLFGRPYLPSRHLDHFPHLIRGLSLDRPPRSSSPSLPSVSYHLRLEFPSLEWALE